MPALVKRPFVLAFFAAVLALLVGGATAFVALDKTVVVAVDGQERPVRSFAGDVRGVLDRAGVTVGEHDTVAPALDAGVADGDRVVVRHGRLLRLRIDGADREVWTTALTVDEALRQLGVRADGAYLSASRSSRIPREGFALTLRQARAVAVAHDGTVTRVRSSAATVADLLTELRLSVGPTDTLSVPPATRLTPGLTLTVTRIAYPRHERTDPVPFATERVADAALLVGTEQVVREGKPGAVLRLLERKVVDGKVVSERLVASRQATAPVSRVVHVGTKAKPRPQPKPQPAPAPAPKPAQRSYGGVGGDVDSLNWPRLAQCESGGDPTIYDPPYYGLYQFDLQTWQSVGGSGKPNEASASEQTYRAKLLYRQRGDSPWPTCGRYLYS